MDLYPLHSMAFTEKDSQRLPVFAGNPKAAFSSDSAKAEAVVQRFLYDAPAEDRRHRRDAAIVALPRLITELEGALSTFAAGA
jgi:hypothetical protein